MNITALGLTQLTRGLRRANPTLAVIGFLLLAYSRSRRPRPRVAPLYTTELRPGQELHLVMKNLPTGPA